MRWSNRMAINAKPPSLNKKCNTMKTCRKNMSRIRTMRDICRSIFIAHKLFLFITRLSIHSNLPSNVYIISNQTSKACCRQGRLLSNSESAWPTASTFCRDCDAPLSLSTSTSATRHLLTPTNASFIDYNYFRQLVLHGANHCPTSFDKPILRRVIAAKIKRCLQWEITGPMFSAFHQPHCQTPHPKCLMDCIKHFSESDESTSFSSPSKEEAFPHRSTHISFLSVNNSANEVSLLSKLHIYLERIFLPVNQLTIF